MSAIEIGARYIRPTEVGAVAVGMIEIGIGGEWRQQGPRAANWDRQMGVGVTPAGRVATANVEILACS